MLEYLKTLVGRELRIHTHAPYDIYGVLLPISSNDYIELRPNWKDYENTRVLVKSIFAVSVTSKKCDCEKRK